MARNTIHVDAPKEAVFAVLADAHAYERFVVGCKKIRAVDEGWPAPETAFHHRVGVGPVTTADYTQVIVVDPPDRLVLRARARPFGTAKVTFQLQSEGEGTHVVIAEEPMGDWIKRIWNPVLDGLTHLRNTETLRRLKNVAEERATIDT
jgi:carbon monoxide dehydrogenase subunit G